MRFNFKWQRLSREDVDRLIIKCNLDFAEQEIFKRLCTGKTQQLIADETTYSRTSISNYAMKIYEKIKNDI